MILRVFGGQGVNELSTQGLLALLNAVGACSRLAVGMSSCTARIVIDAMGRGIGAPGLCHAPLLDDRSSRLALIRAARCR